MMTTSTPITDAAAFGQAVRNARKEQGLSQKALAQRCACSQRFVSELERGKRTAELGKALALCAELGLCVYMGSADPAIHGRDAVLQLARKTEAGLMSPRARYTSLKDYL